MYEEFSDTGDAELEIEAPTLEELFTAAAMGWKNLILEGSTTSPKGKRAIYLIANRPEELMLQWLGELNYFLSVHYQVMHDITKLNIKNEDGQWKLRAEITEEGVLPETHHFKMVIKAATPDQLKIEKTANSFTTRLLFDILKNN